jgi:WD40 repeat protein
VKPLGLLLALLPWFDASGRREALDPQRCGLFKVFRAGEEHVFSVAVSRAAGLAAGGRRDGAAVVWDAWSWAEVRTIDAHKGYCYAAAFSPDGRRLATCGLDGAVRLWSVESWTLDRTLRAEGEPMTALAFASGGKRLVAGGPAGAESWDLEGRSGSVPLRGHELGVAAVSAMGDRAATAGLDGTVRVWDLAAGKELRVLRGHAGFVLAVAFHPGGLLVSAGADGVVRVWEPARDAPLKELEGHRGPVRALAVTQGGRFLVSGGADGARVWEFGSWKASRTLEMGGMAACGLAIGVGGRDIVATGGDNQVRVWRADAPAIEAPAGALKDGFLGVSYVDGGGAFVRGVFPGSQAEKTGFKENDVIVGVDATPVERSDDFLNFMRKAHEGDDLHVRIKRGDEVKVVRVKLGRWADR